MYKLLLRCATILMLLLSTNVRAQNTTQAPNWEWKKVFSGTNLIYKMVQDSSGNSICVGTITDSTTIENQTYYQNGGRNYMAKFSKEGNLIWLKQYNNFDF